MLRVAIDETCVRNYCLLVIEKGRDLKVTCTLCK